MPHDNQLNRTTIDAVRKGLPLTGIDERDAAGIRFGRQLLRDDRMDWKGAMDTAVDEHMPPGRPDLERAGRP